MPNLLIFSRYSDSQASTRVRFTQYLSALSEAGFEAEVFPIIPDRAIAKRSSIAELIRLRIVSLVRVARRLFRERNRETLLIVHYELFPWIPFWMEFGLLRLSRRGNYVVELDDAWFHTYADHDWLVVRWLLGRKIDLLMRHAQLVIAGNQYIADRAHRAGARHVEILPTVVDTTRYVSYAAAEDTLERHMGVTGGAPEHSSKGEQRQLPVVGWIGSPATTRFLRHIGPVITRLHSEGLARVVAFGAEEAGVAGLPITVIAWDARVELDVLHQFDIGIMPLSDDLFARGKCGYKLIQYMACGLPVVASPVGANSSIVVHDETGFLASTDDEWFEYLSRLCKSRSLRSRLGQAGYARAAERYSLQSTSPRLVALLESCEV